MKNYGEILLLSCYELGHQPVSLGWPLAALRRAGLHATLVDLSLSAFPDVAARIAQLVAIAAPMHTALRLGVDAARRVRALNPEAHIVFFGLYAWLNGDYLLHSNGSVALADSVIAGEYETPLVSLACQLSRGLSPATVDGVSVQPERASPSLARQHLPPPDRSSLPALDRYAHYVADGKTYLAGYTEASRGCLHTCRHCPVVPIYQGRFFVVPVPTVLADVRQQVAAGARHITFGDPDFLNGPGHARKLARALHDEFPDLTFDFTTKVEHILTWPDLLAKLAACGATFVVSAFESTSEPVLARLRKGHTVAQMDEALAILGECGLSVQPTWVPFTPWTSLDDYLAMLAWIRSRGLIPATSAVQLSIRLLVPPGSALLDHADVHTWRGALDAENFTWRWEHPDPRMDELQRQVARLAAEAGDDADPWSAFVAVERVAYAAAGQDAPTCARPAVRLSAPPHLTEHWFC